LIPGDMTSAPMPGDLRYGTGTRRGHRGRAIAFAQAGAFMSYRPDLPDLSAPKLPSPTTFALSVNFGATRQLGITLPSNVLFGARQVVEG